MIESFTSIFAPPRDLILVVVALWVGLALAEKRTERHSISKDILNNVAFYSLLSYLIGGRILYVLMNLSAFAKSPLDIFSLNIDLFDPFGGLLVTIIFTIAYAQKQSLSLWSLLDALTPLFALLASGLHLSHLAAETTFGAPTSLPWGIERLGETRHPTQVYEFVASVIILAVLWFRNEESPAGVLFIRFVLLTATARLFFEAFRGDSTLIFGGVRLAQVVVWVVVAVAIWVEGCLRKKDTLLLE